MGVPNIAISPSEWAIIKNILERHVPQYEVWAFGSRAKWTSKEYSDLDLAIITDKPLSLATSAALTDDFSESDLPYKVDVVDWATTSESFRKIIERDRIWVQKSNRGSRINFEVTVMPLEECLDALIDYRGKTPVKTESGIPLITAKIIKGGRIETPTEFIAKEDYDLWMRRGLPKSGDVVLTVEAPLGEVAQLGPAKIALAQRVVTLRGKAGVLDNTYLLYLLQTEEVQSQLKARATGTTVLGIKQSELRKVSLRLPPIDIQVNTAAILKALDDKVALLRETNTTLEAIAQALFKSWFVDFDPVRAKAEGREPEGIPPEIADMFPSEFEDSPLGEIPKGWESMRLDQACEINPTRRLRKAAEAPYLEMAAVPTRGHRPETPAKREFSSGTKFINGDTLLARITPCLENGKTAFVDFLDEDEIGWGSTEYIVLCPKPPLPGYWAYLLCRHNAFRLFAIQAMVGTSGRQRVEISRLAQFPVAVPSEEIACSFAAIVEPIQAKIAANDNEAKTLATLRDTLLPRLMSGKLRIPEASCPTA